MNTPDPRTSLLKRLGLAWCSCLFLIALFAPRQAEAQGGSASTDLALSPSSIEASKVAGAAVGPLAATSPDEVPAGLDKSDWANIRAAHTAWEHSFQPVKGGAWQARNEGQQWSTQFDGRGFTAKPKDADWQWGLELRSYGFGKKQTAVGGQPAVQAEGQRLSYQWDSDVQEWFINDQRGLEHGFNVARRPQGATEKASLDMVLGTRGTLKASVAADAQTVHFRDDKGAPVVTYAGLKVWDADGKVLPSRFVAGPSGGIILRVDESSARYPITIDPIAQQAYLKASNNGGDTTDNFGRSVAVSGDTVVVGAHQEDSGTTGINSTPDVDALDAGAAYVFVRSGSTWTQQAYLKASQVTAGDQFGFSVAVSSDTIVVGASREDSSTTGINSTPDELASASGAAYVFVRSGSTWTQEAYLKASQINVNDFFGYSVAVSSDTIVVGANQEDSSTTGINSTPDEGASDSGAAYVFVRSGSTWTQQAYLKASQVTVGDQFGFSVAVSSDTIVVGAHQEGSSTTGINSTPDELASASGAAYVFVRSGSTWTQEAYLKASQVTAGDQFGYSVAVSSDTIVVGAQQEDSSTTGINSTPDEGATNTGAAYVFARSGSTWTQEAYLKASQVTGSDFFGYSVAVSGETVVVGAFFEDSSTTGINSTPDEGASASGAAYVFVRSGSTWTQEAYLKASQVTVGDRFGVSVAVSGDTVVVGANEEDSSSTGINSTPNELASAAGAANVFTRSGTTWSQQAYLKANNTPSGNGRDDNFGTYVSISGDTIVVGAPLEDSSTTGINSLSNELASASGAAYVFVRSGSTWTQQAYLKASEVSANDLFGTSVSISDDTIVVGAPNENSNTTGINSTANELANDAGAAYVFVRSGSTWTQQAYLKASQVNVSDRFGTSVSISDRTIVVGAQQEDSSTTGINSTPDEGASSSGAAYVFARSGSTWTQEAYLKASQVTAGDQFGYSVAVSSDTIVVGASREDSSTTGINSTPDESASDSGAAYVFARSGSTWTQEAYLKASQVTGSDFFGYSVAVSGDTIVVGAYQEDSDTTGVNSTPNELASSSGAGYVFVRSGSTWGQQAYLKASQVTVGDQFGYSVAVSGDTVVVGAHNEDSNTTGINSTPNEGATGSGAAYVFVRSGSTWTHQAYLKASQVTSNDFFGYSVTMSGDTVVVGAYQEDSSTTGINSSTNENASNSGATYTFTGLGAEAPAPALTNVSPASGTTAGGTNVTITGTDFTGATGVTIGGAAATNVSVVDATTITCTSPAGTAGTASVIVTTAGGSNAANTLYTYVTPPTLAAIGKSGVEDTTVTFTAADFTSAFTDPENDSLASITVATLPATGLLKLSGSDVTASQVILLADLGDLTYVPADHENGARTFTVTASDGTSSSAAATVTMTMTAVNDTPAALALSASSIAENNAANATVGTLSTTDMDAGDTFTYTLVSGAGDTNNASFSISGDALQLTPSADYETQNSYAVRVRTTDAGGLFYEDTFTITVNNLNEAATDITLTPSSIEENNAAGAAVGTLAAVDPDAGDTFTFTLVAGAGDADNADFFIVGDSLNLNVSADFETKPSYSVLVQAEDAAGATFEKALTVTITNANEAPTDLDLSNTSVDENVAANTIVGTFSTTDPDAGNTFTYSLVAGAADTDNARFDINGSALRISASPDFETQNTYEVRVRTTDADGLFYEDMFSITVNNLNEAATDITLTPSSIEENNAPGAAVGTLAATDPDAGDTFTFTLVAGTGGDDNADFSILGDRLQLDVNADFETKASYNLRVQAEDAAGATFEEALTVTITDEPEAPTALDLSDTSVDENVAANTIVGTFSTTDPNVAATHAYNLVAGAGDTDNASFNLSGSALRISASPDFETQASYSIRVRTTNQANGSLFYEETFTITINNLNEAATDITLTPSSIEENNAPGAAVGTLAAVDADAGDTFTFTLVAGAGDADNTDFFIVGDSLNFNVSADFETKPSYSVLVQAEDAAGATFEKALTVTITDEPEAPTALDLSDTSVDENVAANTIVGTFSTTDPDAGNTFTYSLVAGAADTDNASFNISGSALRISASPDFETQNTYEVRVRTTDAGGLFYEDMFTITVNNLNETATDITLTPSSIQENNAAGAAVGTLAATDPDAGDTFTFTLVAGAGDADNADFSIVGDSLQLDVSADFETKASYNLRVQAEDAAGATFEKALTVTITDEPEAPTALDLSDTSIDENVAANTIVGTFSTTDPNVAATHTYSLVAGADDTDNASFNLSGSALRISASPDFETQASYSVRVRTTNQANGSFFYEETFTITINDINDAPLISGGPVALTAVYDHEPATVVAVADVLADASVTYLDQDAADAAGVAVVGAAGAGLWEYSADGVSWAPLGSVGNASALLLPGSYSLRYTPDYPGPDGGETASLTLRAWDQTSGVAGTTVNATTQGGSSAFSTGTVLLSLQVQEDDRAPTLTDVEINEVSSYAVFEVTAVAEQLLLLSLGQDANPTTANATVSAFTLETLNAGSTAWVAHNPVDTIEVPASGTLLVRVGTSGEQDDAFEGSEVFTLVAAALSGASNAGTGTIRDDDEGPVFLAANLTATANDPADPGYPVLDDDVVKFIQWGDAGSLADDSLLDATLATADATYPLLFEGLGQGLFDVSLEASGMAASGLKLIAGQPCWSLTGASGAALTEVSFRFYKPGSTTEFKYLKNVIFRFEDAEQLEQFSGFSYWDGAGTKVTVPWNDSSVFSYSNPPTFSNSNTTVENGATPASQTQAGKWIQVNLSGRQVTGIEFSHRKRVSSAGSVVMTHLAGELAPGALDFGGTFSPLHVGADPGTQAALPDYRSQATWSGGAPATVTQTPAPGTLLSIGIHAVSLTLDLGAGVIARQGFDINAGARASVNASPTVTAVTTTGASLGGTVSSLGNGGPLERGVVYSAFATNADPLLGGTGVTSVIRVGGRGTFTSPVSGLSASTTYAFKAYVTTLYGTTYSDVRFFTTDTGLTFSTGIASLTNQLVRPGESQGFTFSLAESTSAIFSGSGATAGLQWTLFNQVGTAVRSGSGDINFSRALAWGNYRLVVTNPGSAAETFSLNLDTAFPAEPQPDISVGPDATASSGIDVHGPASALQSAVIVSRRAATKTVFFLIDNDGTLADSMRIAGPGPDIRFRISYSLARKNVTAGVIAGVALTPVIDTNDAPVLLSARVAPDRTNPQIMERTIVNGRRTIVWGSRTFGPKYVTVTASTDADFTDTATFKVDTTP